VYRSTGYRAHRMANLRWLWFVEERPGVLVECGRWRVLALDPLRDLDEADARVQERARPLRKEDGDGVAHG
jgi:hypothetical protein